MGDAVAQRMMMESHGITHNMIRIALVVVSSDIRFWSSGDTKTGPPDGLLMGALHL
jgi:hypothetical protein